MFRFLVASLVIFSLSANSVLVGSDDRHSVDAVKSFIRHPHGRHVGQAVHNLLEENYAPYIAPPGQPGVRGARATQTQVLQAVYEESIIPSLTHATPVPQRVEAILLYAKLFAMRGFVPYGLDQGVHLVRVQTLLARLTPGGALQLPAAPIQVGYAHLYHGIIKADSFNHGIYENVPLHPNYAAAWQDAVSAGAYTRSKLVPLLQAYLISECGYLPPNVAGDGVMTPHEAAQYARGLYEEFDSPHEEGREPAEHRGDAHGVQVRLYHPGTKQNTQDGAAGALSVWRALRARTRLAIEALPMGDNVNEDENEDENGDGMAVDILPLAAAVSPLSDRGSPSILPHLPNRADSPMEQDGAAAASQHSTPRLAFEDRQDGEVVASPRDRDVPEMMVESDDEEEAFLARMRASHVRRGHKRRAVLSSDEEEDDDEYPAKREHIRAVTPPQMRLPGALFVQQQVPAIVSMQSVAAEEAEDPEDPDEEEAEVQRLGRWGLSASYDAIRARLRTDVFAEHDRREGRWSCNLIAQWLLATHPAEMASLSLVGEDKETVTKRTRFCNKLFASRAAAGRTVMTHEAYKESILGPCLAAMKAFGQHNDKTAAEVRGFLLENYLPALREAGVLTTGLSQAEQTHKLNSFIRHRFGHDGYPQLKLQSMPTPARSPQVQAARQPLATLLYDLYKGNVEGVDALQTEPELRAYLLAHHRAQLEAAQLLPVPKDDDDDDEDAGGAAAASAASASSAPSEDATALVSFIHKRFAQKSSPGKLNNAHYDASVEDRGMVHDAILQLFEAGKRSQPDIVKALMSDHRSILRRLPRLWENNQLNRVKVAGIVRQFFSSEEAKQAQVRLQYVAARYTAEEKSKLVRFIEKNEGETDSRIAQRWNQRYPEARTHSSQSIGHFKRTYMRPTKPTSRR